MINQWVGIGRLTKDPELRYTNSGTPIASFTLAVDAQRKSSSGDKQTYFFPIVVWGKLGELCGQYLTKGRLVSVFGELQTRSYERNGQKVYVTEVNAQTVQFLDKGEAKEQVKSFGEPARPYGSDPFADTQEIDISDSDLPF